MNFSSQSSDVLNIKELEVQTGIGRATIRFYERQKLLGKVPRRANNYRDYPPELVRELKMLRGMQALGFSLEEVRAVLQGIRARGINCLDGARLLAAKREAINGQIRHMRLVARQLLAEQKRLEIRAREVGPK